MPLSLTGVIRDDGGRVGGTDGHRTAAVVEEACGEGLSDVHGYPLRRLDEQIVLSNGEKACTLASYHMAALQLIVSFV